MECHKIYVISRDLRKWKRTAYEGYLAVVAGRGKHAGWADLSTKVRWLSFFSAVTAGCGTEMTKQLVTGMAGDPDYGTNKQGGLCQRYESLHSWNQPITQDRFQSNDSKYHVSALIVISSVNSRNSRLRFRKITEDKLI